MTGKSNAIHIFGSDRCYCCFTLITPSRPTNTKNTELIAYVKLIANHQSGPITSPCGVKWMAQLEAF
jgi:hypothetical protein